jgi:hypothetical protein
MKEFVVDNSRIIIDVSSKIITTGEGEGNLPTKS